ncbi:MAG: MarR family transcriptional regulator [Planctomycetes bacterium]|nr:MarR family transcriptional regulator [Planctomycetota bacterium]
MPLPRNFKLTADKRTRLGTQLLRLAKRYDRALGERLSRWQLSPTHYEILKVLYAAPDYSLTHSQLAEAMGVTLPSITLAVRKLGALKLVGAQRAKDRRSRIVSLGVKGAELLSVLYESYEGFAEDLFNAIPDKSADKLDAVITRLLSRLSAMEDARVASAA